MADSGALITIEDAVTDFLLGYKKTTEDYVTYLRHALVLLQKYMTFDAKEGRCEKVSVDLHGIIEFPSDCIMPRDIAVARNGEWWTFTERPQKVNTTTTVAGVETQDSTFGEGVAVLDNYTTGLNARGAVNAYYYMVDYKARRIFCDGIVSDTVMLRYVSSGVSITETTYIPTMLVPMLDAYLLSKETFWIPELARERESRDRNFEKERAFVRALNNSLTASQWKDLFYGLFTQNPQR